MDNIDVPWPRSGIVVVTSNGNTIATAEHATLMLAMVRNCAGQMNPAEKE